MTKIGKKAAQDFFGAVSKVFDRVKTVALWRASHLRIDMYMYFTSPRFFLILFFIFETSSILFIRGSCTGPLGRVARMCLCTCFVK